MSKSLDKDIIDINISKLYILYIIDKFDSNIQYQHTLLVSIIIFLF